MKTGILNWGFISTARINKALIDPLRVSQRNELLAVSSRTQQKSFAYAQEHGISRAYGSYQEMLNDPDIDVIYIPLPNSLHSEWAIKAAQCGKHVLCEKPLATTLEEVESMIDAADKAGVILAEAFMYRHHPQTLKVKSLVDDGIIGELQAIRGSFSFYLEHQGDFRLNPALGGGSIWDVGCYPISYARMIVGMEPEEVFGWQVSSDLGIDLIFTGQMRFPNRVLAQFDCSFRSPVRTHIEIIGSTGSISIPRPFTPIRNESIYINRDEISEIIKIPGELLYLGEIEDMADSILLNKPPRINLEDSRGNVKTILALINSAMSGIPINI